MIMTTEQTAFLRECIARDRATGYLGSYTAGGVEDLLDTIDSLRAEVQRLTAQNVSMEAEIRILTEEARRLREIEVSEDAHGIIAAHGGDGTMLVCGEFSSGREFREKYRVRRSDAGRVEVPELTEDDIDAIQDAWPGLEQDDPHHYFTIHEHGVREGYKLACSRLSPFPQPAIQITHIGDSMRDSLQPDGSVLTERWTRGELVERVASQPSADVVVPSRDALISALDDLLARRENMKATVSTCMDLAEAEGLSRDSLALAYLRNLLMAQPKRETIQTVNALRSSTNHDSKETP